MTHRRSKDHKPLWRSPGCCGSSSSRSPGRPGTALEHVVLGQLLEAPDQPLHLPEPADDRLTELRAAASRASS